MSESRKDAHVSPEPVKWVHVWREELEQIKKRRRMVQPDHDEKTSAETKADSNGGQSETSGRNPNESLDEVTQCALDLNLVGLAFSGGGIRSATFNLGILQGLAAGPARTLGRGGRLDGWRSFVVRATSS